MINDIGMKVDTNDLFTVADYAKKGGVSIPAVYKWINGGRVKTIKIGSMLFIHDELHCADTLRIRGKPKKKRRRKSSRLKFSKDVAADIAFLKNINKTKRSKLKEDNVNEKEEEIKGNVYDFI